MPVPVPVPMRTPGARDVLIQGGGLIGLGLAWELSKRGASVRVIDWPQPGRASVVAAGMLAPQVEGADPGVAMELLLAAYASYAADLAAVGRDVGHVVAGALVPARDEDALAALRKRYAWQVAAGLPVEALSGAELAARAPELGPWAGALLLPASAQVEPARLHAALVEVCQERGIYDKYEKEPEIEVSEDEVRLDGAHAFSRLVVADGAWQRWLAGSVRPVRGQLLELQLPHPTSRTLVIGEGGYLVPRGDGRVIVGSTAEEVGFDAAVTDDARQVLLARAARLWPALGAATLVRQTSGLRPATPDALPVAGPVPGAPGGRVFVLGGAYRNGVLLTFELARHMAELLLGRTTPMTAALSPSRPALSVV